MEITKEQLGAVDFLVKGIKDEAPVLALVAPGGCGKTFTMKHLLTDPRLAGINIDMTATTNKAASVLRKEGVDKACSLHSAVSIIINTDMFNDITRCFREFHSDPESGISCSGASSKFLSDIGVKEKDLFSYRNETELLAENKVDPFDERIFSHFSIGDYKGGVVGIDEASLLPNKSTYRRDEQTGRLKLVAIGLDLIMKVYDVVILIGDDYQLPPISGKSSFDGIPKVTLTENHRSEKGLLRVLSHIRSGGEITNFTPLKDENVTILASLSDDYFNRDELIKNKVSHIVFKNKTRKSITHKIRGPIGEDPRKNEPIVYRGANIDKPNDTICKNETGFFNGIVGEWDNHKQTVSGKHFDEYGDGYTYLQYGYAITAHTAQGSSFDYVVVHNDDVPFFIDKKTKSQWLYTAISRARKGIVVVY